MINLKNHILSMVNKPENGVFSSQTLYELAFCYLNVYAIDHDPVALNRLSRVIDLICESQLPDGGFDIGYNFIFGVGLTKTNKLEGTTPELLSLTALAMYVHVTNDYDEKVIKAINLALDWIENRIVEFSGKVYAMPYAPDSYAGIHITNATSFTISAVAASLSLIEHKERYSKFESYLSGMIRFMDSELVDEAKGGSFWPYFYQNGKPEELELGNDKVDNYHIAQQLYHHLLANEFYDSEINNSICERTFTYLERLADIEGFVPYTIKGTKISTKVDVWGYSSLLSAFSLYYVQKNCSTARRMAELVCSYLMSHTWNGEYFYPIVENATKTPFDKKFYPRSDAWVLHGLSDYCRFIQRDAAVLEIINSVYLKIERQDFRGLENHTITWRKVVFGKFVRWVKRLF
jgi:hypothetical protein